ncbi:MAG: hypothetical protein ACREQ5_01690 [Candidatus Dormibacteria bacterium]
MPELYPTPFAQQGLNGGLSANETLKLYREAGGKIGRSTWLNIYSDLKQMNTNSELEPTRDINAVPTGDEVSVFPTSTATGFMQMAQVFYRETGTSTVQSRMFSVSSDALLARIDILQAAADVFGSSAGEERYQYVFLGASYVSTVALTPMGE